MNSSKAGINLHCPSCGFSFEIFDLDLSSYNCPNCDTEIVVRTKESTAKIARTETFIGKIDDKPRLKPGTNLSGFELISEIGRGGMGVVYKALQKSLKREVALKILPEHLSDDVEFIKRFNREAQALATLTHPNIVSILDRCESDGIYFFVMEFVDGKSLRQIMRNRRLNTIQILGIMSDICSGLAYAHSQGIIHRDIKPENILIDTNGIVKIADFGLSIILRKDSEFSRITNTAITMGTLDYMSPEQRISSKSADHRTDIYAVGVMLYELLTNEIPVGNFERPSILEPNLPRTIDDIVFKAMKSSTSDRYQTINQLKDDIDALMENLKNYNRGPNRFDEPMPIPVAQPVNADDNSDYQQPPWEKWNHFHQNKRKDFRKKGFFKTIFSYEFIIVALFISILVVHFIIPILILLLIIRIVFGHFFRKKAQKTDIGSNIAQSKASYTVFDKDPVTANDKSQVEDEYRKKSVEKAKIPENAKDFFNNMKNQLKLKFKSIKEHIQSDMEHSFRKEKSLSKEELGREIDIRIREEVEKKLGIELEKIRQEEGNSSPRFGILTLIAMLLLIFSTLGIFGVGFFIFGREFLLFELYSHDFKMILNFVEWSKFSGLAILFSMFLFSMITAGACKKFNKYGKAMALLALFLTLGVSFFWIREWKGLNKDITEFQQIELTTRTNAKHSATYLQDIVNNPDEFNAPFNATRLIAMKTLFDTNITEYEIARENLRKSNDTDIRISWMKAARFSRMKTTISEVESFLTDKSHEVVHETLQFLIEKYPDRGLQSIRVNYPQFSYENKKWLIREIGKQTPRNALEWLISLEKTKLDDEINNAISKYRTLRALPHQAKLLFS
ncbi:MAG: protein kinase, partial [Planctomycetes bacterium]|nr:protein kinase [Planctomycetota bacterium]